MCINTQSYKRLDKLVTENTPLVFEKTGLICSTHATFGTLGVSVSFYFGLYCFTIKGPISFQNVLTSFVENFFISQSLSFDDIKN